MRLLADQAQLFRVDGSLPADSCSGAVKVALTTLPTAHPQIVAVRVQVRSALATCPPMRVGLGIGGICAAIVTFSTGNGEIVVPLVRGGRDGWYLSSLVR